MDQILIIVYLVIKMPTSTKKGWIHVIVMINIPTLILKKLIVDAYYVAQNVLNAEHQTKVSVLNARMEVFLIMEDAFALKDIIQIQKVLVRNAIRRVRLVQEQIKINA